MPKEVTRGDAPYAGKWKSEIDSPEIEIDVPIVSVVEIRWDRESGYFQMATLLHDSARGGTVTEFPAGLRQIYGEPATKEARDMEEAEFVARAQGQWVTLDRKGINKVIRDLRRARDQAFGRDE